MNLAHGLKHSYMESQLLMFKAESLAILGQPAEVAATASTLRALIETSGNRELESRLDALEAENHVRQRKFLEARAAVARALGAARLARAKGNVVRALKAATRLALAESRFDDARAPADEALALSREIGSRQQTLELHALLGELGLAVGDGSARDHFTAMEALTIELAAPWWQAQAEFGLAATPRQDDAVGLAGRAERRLTGWLDQLTPAGREACARLPELARVLEGNYTSFSLPLRRRAGTGALPRLGFSSGSGPL